MKFQGLAFLFMCLFLVACDKPAEDATPEVDCGKGMNCMGTMKWKIISGIPSFPRNFALDLDDQEQINTCMDNRYVTRVTRGNQVVNLEIDEFHTLSGMDEKFKLTIRDLGDCYDNV